MSDTADLHVSPSQVVTMTGMSVHNVRKLVLAFIEPKFKSGSFSFYLRTEVEEYIELHGHILSLFKVKPRKGETEGEAVEPETETSTEDVQDES